MYIHDIYIHRHVYTCEHIKIQKRRIHKYVCTPKLFISLSHTHTHRLTLSGLRGPLVRPGSSFARVGTVSVTMMLREASWCVCVCVCCVCVVLVYVL